VILLSLAFVVASAVTLVWGIAAVSQGLVWASLAVGLAAAALVVVSVLRRRGRPLLRPAGSAPPLARAAPPTASPQPQPGPEPWPAADPTSADRPHPPRAVDPTVPPGGPGPVAPRGAPATFPPDAPSAPHASSPLSDPTADDARGPAAPAAEPTRGWPGPDVPQRAERPEEPTRPGEPVETAGTGPAEAATHARDAGQRPAALRPAEEPAEHAAEVGERAAAQDGAAEAAEAVEAAERAAAEALRPAVERPLGEPFPPSAEAPPAREGAGVPARHAADDGEPPVEDVPVGDALRAAQLGDEVLVVDGHPRYHLRGCPTLGAGVGAPTTPLPLSVARRSGFTPCGVCRPDGTLLTRSRQRRTGAPATGTDPSGT
jgi:hypothetical protein